MPSLMSSRSSIASVTMRSATSSVVSLPTSSVVSLPLGEFDDEEDPASLAAARGTKSAEVIVDGTAKMGISLVPKDVKLSVTGQVKKEAKGRVTNADLPFKDEHAKHLKTWQHQLIPDFLEWLSTYPDAFGANAHPNFDTSLLELWTEYLGELEISPAVYAQAAAAVRNWRSAVGKTGAKAPAEIMADEELTTAEARAAWVEKKLTHSNFIYENEEAQTGAYRSELVLRVFAAHLKVVAKTDHFYGHPVGALALACAAAERGLHLHKTGTLATEGVKRKGKRSAHSFVAVPWAARAKAYLPAIEKLTSKKWSKIVAWATPFMNTASEMDADDTEAEEGDSRGLIVISDDSDAESVQA
ncbi:hypothetical protein B0H19DRAFT_1203479 [Mycena capillaripes]|nr:hypothetical protein B0H19DRAFT_1203479 [Mycena capillaripes]